MNAALYDGMQIYILIFVIDYDIISENRKHLTKERALHHEDI